MFESHAIKNVLMVLLVSTIGFGTSVFAAQQANQTEKLRTECQAILNEYDKRTSSSLVQAVCYLDGLVRNDPGRRDELLPIFDNFVREWMIVQRNRYMGKGEAPTTDTIQVVTNRSFAWMLDDPYDFNGYQLWRPGVVTSIFLQALREHHFAVDEPIDRMNRLLSDYASYLRGLDRNRLASIENALNYYTGHFKTESEMARDAGCFQFRTFWKELVAMHSRKLSARQSAFEKSGVSPYKQMGEEMRSAETDPFMHRIGLRMDDLEGQYSYAPRSEFFVEKFKPYVSKQVREYLKLEAEEIARPGMVDGFQALTDSALAARKRNWDRFARQYPNSALSQNTGRIDR